MNIPQLTNRQREIACLLLLGLCHKEIAQRLSISIRTVQDHTIDIERAFNVHSIKALVLKLWELPE